MLPWYTKNSILVFLALVNHLVECDRGDIKAAFLNGVWRTVAIFRPTKSCICGNLLILPSEANHHDVSTRHLTSFARTRPHSNRAALYLHQATRQHFVHAFDTCGRQIHCLPQPTLSLIDSSRHLTTNLSALTLEPVTSLVSIYRDRPARKL